MKKLLGVLALGAVCALTVPAQAANVDVNIYGASAQYLLWNAEAPGYLVSLGCQDPVTGSKTTITSYQDSTSKFGIAKGVSCNTSLTGNFDTVTIRYSSKASADGINAIMLAAGDPDNCNGGVATNLRKQKAGADTTSTLACLPVHAGASDVAGSSFAEKTTGLSLGPNGGSQETRNFLTGVDTTGLTSYQPVVVPFGLFVNKAVTRKACTAGGLAQYNAGCNLDSDCDGTTPGSGTCGTAATITNLNREQAVLLFSGQVTNWSQLGPGYVNLPVVACFRHAGSGTMATLDHAVMNGGAWGANLPNHEAKNDINWTPAYPLVGYAPLANSYIWFNESATNEIDCVNGNFNGNNTGAAVGAVGYADCDQQTGVAPHDDQIVLIAYNGTYPIKENIINGSYDFFTNEWVFELGTAPQSALISGLTTFAGSGNIPASKAIFWAGQSEMNYNKTTDIVYIGQ